MVDTNLTTASSASEALGQSEAFILFQEQISQVAPVERPVLILGERGTGKELAASKIHYLSQRWEKPFITLNCSALAPTLIESELFGYEKGAFSGAASRKTGRFETASGGTLFLDEIGTIPMVVQEKILRVVEYGSFERVGSSTPIHVDVRIVAATNANLAAMAKAGLFKQDLLDRLSFEVIYVPPLRYRREDIILLANHFAARMAFELGHENITRLPSKAVKELENYHWPGNIRELKNVVERAVYKSPEGKVDNISFNPFSHPYADGLEKPDVDESAPDRMTVQDKGKRPDVDDSISDLLIKISRLPFKRAVAELEVFLVTTALEDNRYNQKKAALSLGLTYDQFRGIRKKHQLI